MVPLTLIIHYSESIRQNLSLSHSRSHTLTHTHTHSYTLIHTSGLEEKWLHLDEGVVVVPRQTLVADAAEFVPKERRESVLCRWPVHCLRTEVPSHEEICHLDEDQHRNQRKSELS